MNNEQDSFMREKQTKGTEEGRIFVICGHYGSGKTEFAINYAIRLASEGKKTALVDLDIANPYFRSREAQALLESKGIAVYSNAFGYDITADLPAISARIRTPLESKDTFTVVDAGGDAEGARILNQFHKYFHGAQTRIWCVVNAKRPQTSTLAGAAAHIAAIEQETGLSVGALVNNTHLLRETTRETISQGVQFITKLAQEARIPVLYHTYAEDGPCDFGSSLRRVSNHTEDVDNNMEEVNNGPADVDDHSAEVDNSPADIDDHAAEVDNGPADIDNHAAEVNNSPADIDNDTAEVSNGLADIDNSLRWFPIHLYMRPSWLDK